MIIVVMRRVGDVLVNGEYMQIVLYARSEVIGELSGQMPSTEHCMLYNSERESWDINPTCCTIQMQ